MFRRSLVQIMAAHGAHVVASCRLMPTRPSERVQIESPMFSVNNMLIHSEDTIFRVSEPH